MSWFRSAVERVVSDQLDRREASVLSLDTHYKCLFDRAQADADRNKAWLFDAWKALRGQSKGLQRQRRLIKRLQAENAKLRQQLSGGNGDE